MSASPLIRAIQERLRGEGYVDLSTPLSVAGVEFEFTGAMRGTHGRALDLVLLVDTTTGEFGDRDAARVRQRVEALSRGLDVTGSRYVVTVILAGAGLTGGIEVLSETCRVLQVESAMLDADGNLAGPIAERDLDDRIRVLLPLRLPDLIEPAPDGTGPALDQLARALPAETSRLLLDTLIEASQRGEQAVTDAAGFAVGAAFAISDQEGEAS